mmetsp:Transcript_91894/g.259569  ORF Transcript_91894/g.259569 Transcript_91894/m.259569 type:complete len:225 (-) Transcript_91894:426-1100(-)
MEAATTVPHVEKGPAMSPFEVPSGMFPIHSVASSSTSAGHHDATGGGCGVRMDTREGGNEGAAFGPPRADDGEGRIDGRTVDGAPMAPITGRLISRGRWKAGTDQRPLSAGGCGWRGTYAPNVIGARACVPRPCGRIVHLPWMGASSKASSAASSTGSSATSSAASMLAAATPVCDGPFRQAPPSPLPGTTTPLPAELALVAAAAAAAVAPRPLELDFAHWHVR